MFQSINSSHVKKKNPRNYQKVLLYLNFHQPSLKGKPKLYPKAPTKTESPYFSFRNFTLGENELRNWPSNCCLRAPMNQNKNKARAEHQYLTFMQPSKKQFELNNFTSKLDGWNYKYDENNRWIFMSKFCKNTKK